MTNQPDFSACPTSVGVATAKKRNHYKKILKLIYYWKLLTRVL